MCEQWKSLCACCVRNSLCMWTVAKPVCLSCAKELLCVNSGKLCACCVGSSSCVNSRKACVPVVCEIAYVCEQWQSLWVFCVRKSLCLKTVAKLGCLLCVNSGKLVCLLIEKDIMCVSSEKACAHVVCERANVLEQWQSLCASCVLKSICLWRAAKLCACFVWTMGSLCACCVRKSLCVGTVEKLVSLLCAK
jgi:hypothetical protein